MVVCVAPARNAAWEAGQAEMEHGIMTVTSNNSKFTALRLDGRDNVATALRNHAAGEQPVLADGEAIILLDAVRRGHKFALTPLAQGSEVIKYGHVIGHALADIRAGEHVHLHNLEGVAGKDERRGGKP